MERESRVLCVIPAQSTTKGAGRPPEPPSGPTRGFTPTLKSKQGKRLLVFTPWCYRKSLNKALPEFLTWPHQFLLIKEPKDPGHYHIEGQYSNSMAATPYLPQFLITWPLHENMAAGFHQSKHTMRTSVTGARVIFVA